MPPRKTAAAKKAAAAAAAAEKAEKEKDKEETVVDVPPPSAEVGDKREREEEEPPAKEEEKKAKVESENGGEEEVDPPSASAAVMAEEAEVAEKKSPTWTPVKLGPKTFDTPEDAIKYISWLLNTVTMHQDLNDYERLVVEGMLRRGHEDAKKKIGESGIKSIQVKVHQEHDSKCYYVVRNDGSRSDFSYRKCVEGCFPGWDKSNASKSEYKPEGRGRHGGRGGGRRHHGGGGGGGGYRRY